MEAEEIRRRRCGGQTKGRLVVQTLYLCRLVVLLGGWGPFFVEGSCLVQDWPPCVEAVTFPSRARGNCPEELCLAPVRGMAI